MGVAVCVKSATGATVGAVVLAVVGVTVAEASTGEEVGATSVADGATTLTVGGADVVRATMVSVRVERSV